MTRRHVADAADFLSGPVLDGKVRFGDFTIDAESSTSSFPTLPTRIC